MSFAWKLKTSFYSFCFINQFWRLRVWLIFSLNSEFVIELNMGLGPNLFWFAPVFSILVILKNWHNDIFVGACGSQLLMLLLNVYMNTIFEDKRVRLIFTHSKHCYQSIRWVYVPICFDLLLLFNPCVFKGLAIMISCLSMWLATCYFDCLMLTWKPKLIFYSFLLHQSILKTKECDCFFTHLKHC